MNFNSLIIKYTYFKTSCKWSVQFLNKNKIKSKVVVLADGRANSWIDKVDPEWSGAIPATVLLYGQASTFYEKSYHTTAELESDIIKILNKNK